MILARINQENKRVFRWGGLPNDQAAKVEPDFRQFSSYTHAYHQLVSELAEQQLAALALVQGHQFVRDIYLDGGFERNRLFVFLLQEKGPQYNIMASNRLSGPSIGAALSMTREQEGMLDR